MANTQEEIRECPICGGESEFHSTISDSYGFCRCKRLCVEQHFSKSREQAIKEWNNRK